MTLLLSETPFPPSPRAVHEPGYKHRPAERTTGPGLLPVPAPEGILCAQPLTPIPAGSAAGRHKAAGRAGSRCSHRYGKQSQQPCCSLLHCFFLNICICIYIKQPWLCCGLPMACIPTACPWAPCNTQELLGKGLKCPQFVSSGSPKPRRGWFQPGLPRRALQRCWVPFLCRNQGCPASHGGPAPTGQCGRPTSRLHNSLAESTGMP